MPVDIFVCQSNTVRWNGPIARVTFLVINTIQAYSFIDTKFSKEWKHSQHIKRFILDIP